MRWILIYIVVAFLLNVTVNVYPPAANFLQKGVFSVLMGLSYPISKGLSVVQEGINKYLVLISTEEENRSLKFQLSKCILINKELTKFRFIKSSDIPQDNLLEATFSFKGNFRSDEIYLYINKKLNLNKNYCFVLSDKLSLVGIIKDNIRGDIYSAETVFNPSFVADVFIKSDNSTYKALFIGSEYSPKVEFLDPNVKVKQGDKVFTTGALNIYPYGLFIGRVISIDDVNGYYKVAHLKIDRSFFNNWKVFVLCRKKF
ncbi:rod shape-determining protein MreC [Hippea maritima]|uniref:Rod shape-determining protein MreC n=1 Tax=Hippea maritima (strain ATCC 700847 / DSM 10411 / MH2) TaxID=760142 RepID=F2LUB7_HIPMA|nr:rod shape-determining protein MreC [Hippea maritima]AEA33443.1 Rod shape-determining protein MreC [Hippea maritima DSM 10411]